jgi:hypothetical protein
LRRFAPTILAVALLALAVTASVASAPATRIVVSIEGTQRFTFVYTPLFELEQGNEANCRFRASGEQVIRFRTSRPLRAQLVRTAGQYVAEIRAFSRGAFRSGIPLVGSEARTWKLEQVLTSSCDRPAVVRREAHHDCRGTQALPGSASVVAGVPDAFKSLEMHNPVSRRFMPAAFPACDVPRVFDLRNNFVSPLISICCARPLRPGPLRQFRDGRLGLAASTVRASGDVRFCLHPTSATAVNYRLIRCQGAPPRTAETTISGDFRTVWKVTLRRAG